MQLEMGYLSQSSTVAFFSFSSFAVDLYSIHLKITGGLGYGGELLMNQVMSPSRVLFLFCPSVGSSGEVRGRAGRSERKGRTAWRTKHMCFQ